MGTPHTDRPPHQTRHIADHEETHAGEHRRASVRALAAICSLLLLTLLFFILPKKDISESENRPLAALPTCSLRGLWTGAYPAALSDYCTDHFPFRTTWLSGKTVCELLLQKQENNDVLYGKNGTRIDRLEYSSAEYTTVANNLDSLRNLQKHLDAGGLSVTLRVAPRTIDVLRTSLPVLYSTQRAERTEEWIEAHIPSSTALLPLLRERASENEYVMYRTDHHWTTLGAYYAYVSLGETLGYTPRLLSSFRAEVATDAFLGTTASASLGIPPKTDTITLYHSAVTDTCTVTLHDTQTTKTGLYDRAALGTRDAYRVFLGGNFGYVSIKANTEADRETLLLVKDSFSLSLVPFLLSHFDLELYDPRYATMPVDALLEKKESSPSRALILLGIDTLATTPFRNMTRKHLP